MMKTISLFMLFFAGCLMAEAQAYVFAPGWVVKNNGDTLKGFVKGNDDEVYFREAMRGKFYLKFDHKQIQAYKWGDDLVQSKCFEVLRGSFPEVICSFINAEVVGPVNLYKWEGNDIVFDESQVCYYVQHEGGEMIRVRREAGAFRHDMRIFFSNFPDLSAKIKAKAFDYDQIKEVVTLYNDYITKQKSLEQ